ncbi:hypothetical protein [Spongiactinospora sp. TRM90649]|uniref:hypothetical protein n=1 Tax=Spongiactinospora sp. TRM90649 TaxID=3031114 RepID=UPI0023F7717C|nr:hypothetical protein [Spongiactinospora sp. TRM90649]MDF5753645.1 hypothetical protein [Spongiactinospora sp. TRM90649]
MALDYYLIDDAYLLVEEFALHDDHTAAGIDSAQWDGAAWHTPAESSRLIRADRSLRVRVLDREEAEATFTRVGGGELPGEDDIRSRFGDRWTLPTDPPLDFGTSDARHYRVLFAGSLYSDDLTALASWLSPRPAEDPRVVGTGSSDGCTWELRRIGGGVAWALDMTVPLTGIGIASTLLTNHRQAIRAQGLIPVTIERFA